MNKTETQSIKDIENNLIYELQHIPCKIGNKKHFVKTFSNEELLRTIAGAKAWVTTFPKPVSRFSYFDKSGKQYFSEEDRESWLCISFFLLWKVLQKDYEENTVRAQYLKEAGIYQDTFTKLKDEFVSILEDHYKKSTIRKVLK